MNLREIITKKMIGMEKDELSVCINSAVIESKDETLLSLGVILEIYWQNSDDEEKSNIIDVVFSTIN